jgi:hypothetical protein
MGRAFRSRVVRGSEEARRYVETEERKRPHLGHVEWSS